MPTSLLLKRIVKGAFVVALFIVAVPVEAGNPGTVLAWGNNDSGQTTVPAGLSGVATMTAGFSHTLALMSNGTVIAWGDNYAGKASVPAGLTGVIAIAAGEQHSVALKSDGTVVAWGAGKSRTMAYAEDGQSSVPVGLSGVRAIAAGGLHTAALKSDGSVVAWGNRYYGETVSPSGLTGVVAIATSVADFLALKSDGTVVAWGGDSGTYVPAGLVGVMAIAAGGYHLMALKSNGTVVAWGDNSSGQVSAPVGLGGVTAIAAGVSHFYGHLVALKSDGTVVAWGNSTYGQTNVPFGITNVTAIAAGGLHTLAFVPGPLPSIITAQPVDWAGNATSVANFSVIAAGTVPLTYQWRKDGLNIAGATNNSLALSDVQTNAAGGYQVVITNAYGSVTSSVAVLSVNRLAQTINFGSLPAQRLGDAPITLSATASSGLPISYTTFNPSVATAGGSSLTLNGIGTAIITASQAGDARYLPVSVIQTLLVTLPSTVVVWGDNSSRQTDVPADLSGVMAIASGWYHIVTLRSNGTVLAWGSNGFGQTNAPVDLYGVVAIAAGVGHTVALKSDGTVLTWGATTNVPTGLRDVVAIAAGGHTVALKNNGTVVAWGSNGDGQTNVPANLSGIVAVAAGGSHTVALKSDGTVVAWGAKLSNFGQATVPIGLNGVMAIAAGRYHSVALKSDGTVVAWGYNGQGQKTIPPGLNDVRAIAGGGGHTVALKNDGTLVAWGDNAYGQTTLPAALSRGTTISAGDFHTAALVPVPLPIITAQPVSLTVNVASNAIFNATPSGMGPFSYQWMKNGVLIAGQTNSQLNLSGLTNRASGGSFSVVVSNLYGAVTGNIGSLRVRVPHRLQPPVVTNGMFRLLSADQDGGPLTTNDLPFFSVQTSTNLAATNWLSFTYTNGLSLTNGMLRLDDTNAASRPFRYYRVIEQ